MPHKVNPIDFENAEGNFGLATALAQHFAEKLPVSRFQRDLSDSTVLRSVGTALGHTLLAVSSLCRGLGKIDVDTTAMERDLQNATEVLAEAIQTVMRRHGVSDAYERLKDATRGHPVTRELLDKMINECVELPADDKARLLALRPGGYVGCASRLAKDFAAGWKDR
jgi:adenylosuccinate lyase